MEAAAAEAHVRATTEGFVKPEDFHERALVRLDELESHIARTLAPLAVSATFIAQHPDDPDRFVQFTSSGTVARFDFPLITDVQRAGAKDVEAIANELRIPLQKIGFLRTSEIRVTVEGTPFRVARVARAFAERILNVAPDGHAKIEYFGYVAD
jgi:hypothetical protein